MGPPIFFFRHLQMVAASDAQKPLVKTTCGIWDGVNSAQQEQHKNYLPTMSRYSPTPSYAKLESFATTLSPPLFVPILTKPRPSTKWATKRHGILLEPSRFPLSERRRSELLHLYQQYLHPGNFSQCRLYILAKVVVCCPMQRQVHMWRQCISDSS